MWKRKKKKPEETPERTPEAEEAEEAAEEEAEGVEATDAEEVTEAADDAEPAHAADAVEEVAEAAPAEAEEAAAADAEAAEEVPEEAAPLKPQVTVLTLVLCGLTLLAAIGTAVIVALDHGKRQEWSYAVFLHDLALGGLPLAEESAGTTGSREALAVVHLDPAAVKQAYQQRPTGGKGAADPFQGVDELTVPRIRPEDIGPDTAKTLFQGVGEPVKTLEQEVERVKQRLPADINAAAQETGKGQNDDARRKLARKVLFPLARNPFQVNDLDLLIQESRDQQLTELLDKGAKLRMIAEVLGPLEARYPAKTNDNLLSHLADGLKDAKVMNDAEALLRRRIDAVVAKTYDPELYGESFAGKQRTSFDKREDIAFLLYTVSQVRKPDGQPLYPQGPQRTEVVVGLNEYTHAADRYAAALTDLREHIMQRNEDALNYVFADGDKLKTLPAFAERYPDEIKAIQDLKAQIDNANFRLKEYQSQQEQHVKQLKDRQEHYDKIKIGLDNARAETARLTEDLHKLQQEYFEAQRRLSNAQEMSLRKREEIRKLEQQQRGLNP
jgi:hypothetical protein